MPFIATSSRRQLAMAALLAAAATGGVIRYHAPDPSTLRDIGTLMLVLWLPAIGNLIAFVVRRMPRRAPPPTQFQAGSSFKAQLQARLELLPMPDGFIPSLNRGDDRATLITGGRGFTVRMQGPVAAWLTAPPPQPVALECLLPDVALRTLAPGTAVHLLVGTVAVAKGRIEAASPAR